MFAGFRLGDKCTLGSRYKGVRIHGNIVLYYSVQGIEVPMVM